MSSSPPVIDLTEEDDATAHTHAVSPEPNNTHRPSKKLRTSRRIKEAQNSQTAASEHTDAAIDSYTAKLEPKSDSKDVVYRKDDYYEVEEILDRRTRKYGGEGSSGGRHVAEYLVRWKNPPDYDGEGQFYDDDWQIAENLDHYSLASAFRLFPMDGDRNNDDEEEIAEEVDVNEDLELDLNLGDDLFDEDEDNLAEGDEDILSNDAKESLDDDDEDDDAEEVDAQTDNDIAHHLGDSEYDAKGTVELELNRKTYRVGQSFMSPDGDSIYTISMILPIQRKAKCHKYMKMKSCFACPKGKEEMFIQLSDEVTLDLTLLQTFPPSKAHIKKFPLKYKESEKQRSFSYYDGNGTAKVLHHPTGKPTVLELFAGVGGMSIGLENAGFDVKWVVDSNHLAVTTLAANRRNPGDVNVYAEKLSSFLKNCIKESPAYPKPGEVDHIHASPPCKGFSRANRNGGKDDAMNNKQTLLFVKAIQHFRPKTATFENVEGLLTAEYKDYLMTVVSSLLAMRYQVRVQKFNASEYGDPQNRRRLFLIASRHDCLLPLPPVPTHGHGPNLLPIKTCKDALHVFDKEPTGTGALLLRPTNTIVWNHIAPRLAPNKDKDYELFEDQPSRTILARSRPHIHYNGSRYITVREAAALQSFPSTFRFSGSLSSQYSQVGNAVPICLATSIARSVVRVHGAP